MDWFSADWHLGHNNIIKYCQRPFENPTQMRKTILERYFDVVKPGDSVYLLGDLAMSVGTLEQLIPELCKHNTVHIILGNHDFKMRPFYKRHCASVSELKHIKIGEQCITLCHFAMRTWHRSHKGSWNLYGHSHGELFDIGLLQHDVGVDANDFKPVSFTKVQEIMSTKIPKCYDGRYV